MTPFVDLGVIGDGLGATGVGRDDGESAALIELKSQPVAIKGFVADQRAERDAIEERLHADAVVALSRQEDEAGEIAERVDKRHDLVVRPPRDLPMA